MPLTALQIWLLEQQSAFNPSLFVFLYRLQSKNRKGIWVWSGKLCILNLLWSCTEQLCISGRTRSVVCCAEGSVQYHGQNSGGELRRNLSRAVFIRNGNGFNQEWFEVVISTWQGSVCPPWSLLGPLWSSHTLGCWCPPALSIPYLGRFMSLLPPTSPNPCTDPWSSPGHTSAWEQPGIEAAALGTQEPTSLIPTECSSSWGNSLMALLPACRWSLISFKIMGLLLDGSIFWIAL